MLIPNRTFSSPAYRYGFNGMEKDDELKGIGNSYDFGARMLDPRVGRWFATDAFEMKYPNFSPYNFALNSPIYLIDPDGNDIEPFRYRWHIFGYQIGGYTYPKFPNDNEGARFDKTNTQLQKSSNIYAKVLNQLSKSSRTYRFQASVNSWGKMNSIDSGGFFNRNATGTKDDPYTINFVVDYNLNKSYTASQTVIFEEVFHAAQWDYALENNEQEFVTNIKMEVEAKLAKNIEGIKGVGGYEQIEFEGKDEIFAKIRNRKKLTSSEKVLMEGAIYDLEKNIRRVYEKLNPDIKNQYFDHINDLKFIENLYGQELTNKPVEVIVTPEKNEK